MQLSGGSRLLLINKYIGSLLPSGLLLFSGCNLTVLNWLVAWLAGNWVLEYAKHISWQLQLVVVAAEKSVAHMLKWHWHS